MFSGSLWISAFVLGGSHLFSFFVNYLGKGEFRRTALPVLMAQPYGRIMVLHFAILFGAFAVMLLGSPVFLLLILIGGKIWLDVKMHLRERRKNEGLATAENASGGPSPTLQTATARSNFIVQEEANGSRSAVSDRHSSAGVERNG